MSRLRLLLSDKTKISPPYRRDNWQWENVSEVSLINCRPVQGPDFQGLPFTFYIRAGLDGTGTHRAIDSITTGLRWRLVQEPLLCHGEYRDEFEDQCRELGLYMAASLDAGLF